MITAFMWLLPFLTVRLGVVVDKMTRHYLEVRSQVLFMEKESCVIILTVNGIYVIILSIKFIY